MRRAAGCGLAVTVAATIATACGSSATSSSSAGSAQSSAPSATSSSTLSSTTTTASASNATDAYPLVAGYAGHFTGTWNDTTFATTGTMTWDVAPDPATRQVTITVNVGGRFFGSGGAPPEKILLTHLAEGNVGGTSQSFGKVAGTIKPDGTFTMALTSIPGGTIAKVDVTGTFSGGSNITMQYSVSFNGSSQTAIGTVALAKS